MREICPSRSNPALIKTLANLRFLFNNTVDILTCDTGSGYVVAFACKSENGERVKIMQTYAGDVLKALKALHDMSSNRIMEYLAHCGHELRHDYLPECHISLPMQIQCAPELNNPALSGIDSAPIDIPFPEEDPGKEEPESLEAQDSPTVILEGIRKNSLS